MAGETLAQNERIAALLNALTDVVSAWDSLKPGSYDKDIWETWLLQKMEPAIERARLSSLANRMRQRYLHGLGYDR